MLSATFFLNLKMVTDHVKRFLFRDYIRPYFCEFIGTFFLCTIITWSSDSAEKLGIGPLVYGLTYALVTYMTRNYSGGHVNPAISLCFMITGALKFVPFLLYVACQVGGAALAAFVFSVNHADADVVKTPVGAHFWSNFSVEMLGTLSLVLVVLNSRISRNRDGSETPAYENYQASFFGFIIGSTAFAWTIAAGEFSGGVFNPAIGTMSVVFGKKEDLLLYWFGPLVGAVVGVFVFILTNPHELSGTGVWLINQSVQHTRTAITEARYVSNAMLNEFVGTMLFSVVFSLIVASKTAGSLSAFAIGMFFAAMVYSGAHISGGHYNPAVSFAVFLRAWIWRGDTVGGMFLGSRAKQLLFNIVAQLAGAFAAAGICILLVGESDFGFPAFGKSPLGGKLVEARSSVTFGNAFLSEFLGLQVLCGAFLHTTSCPRKSGNNGYYGFAIGLSLALAIYAFGNVGGGVFNPALAMLQTVSGAAAPMEVFCYWSSGAVGAVVAAFTFWLLVSDEDGEDFSEAIGSDEEKGLLFNGDRDRQKSGCCR